MWRPDESVKEAPNIAFRSTSDNNFEPPSMRSGVGQALQDFVATESIATFINCIDDEDKSMIGVARKFADELKEERILHRPWCQVRVIIKALCHDVPKGRKAYREFVDERRQDISGLAQTFVIPPAEKGTGKVFSLKPRTNRMS